MSDLFDESEGATLLDPGEREGLKVSWVTFRSDLNQVEQANIEKATVWAMRSRHRQILSLAFILDLHKRMLGDVWTWAGTYRTTARNIGIDAWKIPMELNKVLDTAHFWGEQDVYSADEIAIRLHHQLVLTHPFPNGNGRWARLMADIVVVSLGGQRFSWGRKNLGASGEARKAYIAALRKADGHEIADLLVFARS